jgi:hypothetical protein
VAREVSIPLTHYLRRGQHSKNLLYNMVKVPLFRLTKNCEQQENVMHDRLFRLGLSRMNDFNYLLLSYI